MKVLITGSTGQVGQAFLLAACHQFEVIPYAHSSLDISQPDIVHEAITKHKPDLIINAAAYTLVDQAEQDKHLAFQANAEGPKHLAATCARYDIPLIHLSTDYVFSGNQSTPYLETDPPHPLNVYGESKLLGEQAVSTTLEQHLIVRVSGIFSLYKINFVKKMIELGRQREELNVVDNQFLCPTSAGDIANFLCTLANSIHSGFDAWGTYHYCSADTTSWFNFAHSIFQYAKTLTPLALKILNPVPSSAFPTPARRPAFSALNCEKICQQLNIKQPSWQESLPVMISELLK